jgi:lipid-A-disaccharide synthase
MARKQVAASGLPIEVHLGKTPELIHLAECTMAVSGSVSLELLYHTRPTVILYWITPLSYRVQTVFRRMGWIRVKYITLVNLLTADELFPADNTTYDPTQPGAADVLFPEYLTCEDRSQQIAGHVVQWLTNESDRQQKIAELSDLKARICYGGASTKAAEYVLRTLGIRSSSIPGPHFGGAAKPPAVSQPSSGKLGLG